MKKLLSASMPATRKSASSMPGGGDDGRDEELGRADSNVTERRRSAPAFSASPASSTKRSSYATDPFRRRVRDKKVVGLGDGLRRAMDPTPPELLEGSKKVRYEKYNGDIPLEDDEKYARSKVEKRPFVLVMIGYYTACKIFCYYLISLSSIITIALSAGLTFYWYDKFQKDPPSGTGLDWVLLGFAVITPLSLSVGIAFRRRERALVRSQGFGRFWRQKCLGTLE